MYTTLLRSISTPFPRMRKKLNMYHSKLFNSFHLQGCAAFWLVLFKNGISFEGWSGNLPDFNLVELDEKDTEHLR